MLKIHSFTRTAQLLRSTITGLAVLGLALPSLSAAPTLEERLQQLEQRLDALEQENEELRSQLAQPKPPRAEPPATPTSAPAVSPSKTPVVAIAAGKETKLVVGGFVQGQAEFGEAGDQRFVGVNDRFYFRRARIYLAGSFAEYFDFKAELDLAGNSLGTGSDRRAQANEIFINWNRFPAANVRFGQLKPAFGGEQLTSDTVMPTIERFLGSDRLTDGRQPGIGLYGTFFEKRLGYMVTLGNGNGANSSSNDNDEFMSAARVYGTLFDSPAAGKLTVGANALRSEDNGVSKAGLRFDSTPTTSATDNLFTGNRHGWGADAEWKSGPLELSGEYLRTRYEPRNARPAPRLDAEGWHLTAAYFVVPAQLQAVLRREGFDPNVDVGGDSTQNWTAGLNYLLKGNDIKFMLNYLFGDAAGLANDDGRILARVQLIY